MANTAGLELTQFNLVSHQFRLPNHRCNQCCISVHPVEKCSDIKGQQAFNPEFSVIVSVSHSRGDSVRAQKLFNMFSCIFKHQLRQPVPPQLQHTMIDGEVTETEASRLQTAGVLHKELPRRWMSEHCSVYSRLYLSLCVHWWTSWENSLSHFSKLKVAYELKNYFTTGKMVFSKN